MVSGTLTEAAMVDAVTAQSSSEYSMAQQAASRTKAIRSSTGGTGLIAPEA
jgi:hypothetical protein